MKKFVSGILSTALFIGSGIPASASSDYGYKRPSIHRNNYHHRNSNTGFRLKMGEKLVSVQDYFKLSRDTGEYLVLDSNKKVTNLLKRAKNGQLVPTNFDMGGCLGAILTALAGVALSIEIAELYGALILECGLETAIYMIYVYMTTGTISGNFERFRKLFECIVGLIAIPSQCF